MKPEPVAHTTNSRRVRARLMICGGGTGGHFFSGLAVGEKFLRIFQNENVLFVGASQGIEARHPWTDERMRIAFIPARGLKGKSIFARFVALFVLANGFIKSLSLILRERPAAVLGVGGYASFPTVATAILLRPFLKMKVGIIEQNSVPGLANRVLSRFLRGRSYSAFPVPGFEVVDLPLRIRLEQDAQNARTAEWPPKVIFVPGGSQGARSLNRRWLEIVPALLATWPDLEIIHQTGNADVNSVAASYNERNIRAEVFSFSDRMSNYYARADLVISRAGAMTVFELIAFRRPTLFVPFPAATDDHQRMNAPAVTLPKWVLREEELTEDRLIQVLQSAQPQIPTPRVRSRFQWEGLVRELVTD